MSIENGYLNLADLQQSLNGSVFVGVADYELAIESASRWIDDRCSDPEKNIVRHFWKEQAPGSTRYYHADSRRLVKLGDFDDSDDLLVEVDLVGDGTWTTMDPSNWQAEPLVRINGDPYTRIAVTSYDVAFPLGMQSRVRATAPWGFAAVPKQVESACKVLAVAFMLGISVIADTDGYSAGAGGPTDPFALAENMLRRYLPLACMDVMAMPGKR